MTDNTPEDSQPPKLEFVGFGPRLVALIVDYIVALATITPVLALPIANKLIYGSVDPGNDAIPAGLTLSEELSYALGPIEVLLTWMLPFAVYLAIWFWIYTTPGKWVMRMAVVDATTGRRASSRQYTIRFFAYFVSAFPLMLGYFAVLWDDRKQGWHDKLAGTVVIVNKDRRIDL